MSESTFTLDTDDAQELAWGESFDQFVFVAKQHVSKHRWYTRHLIVFREGEVLFGFYYDEPATEEQEGQDRFDSDPVKVFPVEAEEVTTTVYKAAA